MSKLSAPVVENVLSGSDLTEDEVTLLVSYVVVFGAIVYLTLVLFLGCIKCKLANNPNSNTC